MLLSQIKQKIASNIKEIIDHDININDFSYPPNTEMGDLSLPCFSLAKEAGKNPAEIANELVEKLSSNDNLDFISSITAQGPYLNFKLKAKKLGGDVIGEITNKKEKFGQNDSGKRTRVMIEYSNANTHKEFHIGHLRNLAFGDSIYRILDANGYKAIPVSYINDFGIHVAKTLWAYLEYFKEADLPENKGEFLGQVYVRATNEAKDNKTAKGLIEVMMKKIESRQGEEYELWQKTREWTIEQFADIYKELNIKFEHTYYESEFIDQGRESVKGLLEKGILKESEGAVIADLEEYKLGVLVVLRSDGTATYPVADIPLAEAKFQDYDLDTSIYVVDNRQQLYFKQLFKILELMGYKQKKVHLEYDFVKLPDGMMSSRSGNTVTYEELKQDLVKAAKKEIFARHQDWDQSKAESVAWELSQGAMKFEMLKVGADQIITFDKEQALSFSGFTAAYIQYTCARINSIIRKAGDTGKESDYDYQADKEKELLIKLAKYEEAVLSAGNNYGPSVIAKYLFELAQIFNDYYHSVPILKADKNELKGRVALIVSVNQVIKNGLFLLGINIVEEM